MHLILSGYKLAKFETGGNWVRKSHGLLTHETLNSFFLVAWSGNTNIITPHSLGLRTEQALDLTRGLQCFTSFATMNGDFKE